MKLRAIMTIMAFVISVVAGGSVYAHPGATDKNGGHTCRTNCAKYGLKDGEYHLHDKNGNVIHVDQKTRLPLSGTVTTPKVTKVTPVKFKANMKISTKVIKKIDGDTIVVQFPNKSTEKVRLLGVNTPETVHPNKPVEKYGKEASAYTGSRLLNKTVTLELDVAVRDKYGRLLAIVWIGNENFNLTLVKEGYAQVMTIQPNVKYADEFVAAQKAAREAKKGLWK